MKLIQRSGSTRQVQRFLLTVVLLVGGLVMPMAGIAPVRAQAQVAPPTVPVAASGSVIINTSSGQCLGVEGEGAKVQARVIQWTCNGADNQRWEFYLHPMNGRDYYQSDTLHGLKPSSF